MLVDRYVKIVLTVVAIALAVIAVRPWLSAPDSANAETAVPKYEVTIPKGWGKYVAYSNNNLLLQAQDGSMRIVDVEGKTPEYPKVKVLIRWE
jgi:hypothetical protein